MEIDAQHLIDSLREQRNDALDQVAMLKAALSQQAPTDNEGPKGDN